MVRREALRRLLGGLLMAGLAHAAPGEDAPRGYSFGIVPQQAPGELARLWTPLLRHLSEQTGIELRFETARDIATFERRLLAGEFDFAYSNPLTYAAAYHPRVGYEAFARENRSLAGLVVVRKDSRYKDLGDLAGETLAFPAEGAMAATIVPRAELDRRRVPYTPHYVGSHDSVFLAVVKGFFAAGGGAVRTLEMLPPAQRAELRVLWRTPDYPSHPFAAHPRVPADIVRRIQAAMLALDRSPEGRAVLAPLTFPGIVVARDADYEGLRALGLKLPEYLAR